MHTLFDILHSAFEPSQREAIFRLALGLTAVADSEILSSDFASGLHSAGTAQAMVVLFLGTSTTDVMQRAAMRAAGVMACYSVTSILVFWL